MNPLLAAALRRHIRPLIALALALLLEAAHAVAFAPLARRYDRVVRASGGTARALEPAAARPLMPPRVFALVRSNSIPAADALVRGSSGQLQVTALEELSALAAGAGLRVALAEPGPVTQLPASVEVRVRLRARGTYAHLTDFLDRAIGSGHVYGLERLAVQEGGDGLLSIELGAVRLILKQAPDSTHAGASPGSAMPVPAPSGGAAPPEGAPPAAGPEAPR
jgi:hypothetical protein